MKLCGSELRFAFGAGLPEIVRLAADAGFEGIAVGTPCALGDVAPLIAASISAGLAVPLVAAPLGDRAPALGRRLPHLAAIDDSDERRAGVALFEKTLAASLSLGVKTFTVDLGEVPLRTEATEVARRFARRELADEGPGARLWAAALGERRARSAEFVDACRIALDRILPMAERREVYLAIEIAGDPWRGPTPREALALLDEYRSGPIGVVWDEARMRALAALGLAPPPSRLQMLVAAARVWRANEAVGIDVGYLPGLGDPADFVDETVEAPREAAPEVVRLAPPAGVPVVVTGRSDSTVAEVARARVLSANATAATAAT